MWFVEGVYGVVRKTKMKLLHCYSRLNYRIIMSKITKGNNESSISIYLFIIIVHGVAFLRIVRYEQIIKCIIKREYNELYKRKVMFIRTAYVFLV